MVECTLLDKELHTFDKNLQIMKTILFDLATRHNMSPKYALFIVTDKGCVPSHCHHPNAELWHLQVDDDHVDGVRLHL
jgi:hypothetical protein